MNRVTSSAFLIFIGFISEYLSLVGNTLVGRDLLHMYVIGEVIKFELAFSIILRELRHNRWDS